MHIEDLRDPDILAAKREQIEQSLTKFTKYFRHHYEKLKTQELSSESMGQAELPKFHYCFNELALLFGIDGKKSMRNFLRSGHEQRARGPEPPSIETHTSEEDHSPRPSSYDVVAAERLQQRRLLAAQ